MINVAISSLAVLLILATWKLMILPSLRGMAEDELWFLEREARRLIKSHPNESDRSALEALRHLLIAQKKSIRTLSVLEFATFSHARQQSPDLFSQMDESFSSELATPNKEVANLIERVRMKAVFIQFSFMAAQYFWVWVAAVLAIPCIVMRRGISVLASVSLAFGSKVFSFATGDSYKEPKQEAMQKTMEELSLKHATI